MLVAKARNSRLHNTFGVSAACLLDSAARPSFLGPTPGSCTKPRCHARLDTPTGFRIKAESCEERATVSSLCKPGINAESVAHQRTLITPLVYASAFLLRRLPFTSMQFSKAFETTDSATNLSFASTVLSTNPKVVPYKSF